MAVFRPMTRKACHLHQARAVAVAVPKFRRVLMVTPRAKAKMPATKRAVRAVIVATLAHYPAALVAWVRLASALAAERLQLKLKPQVKPLAVLEAPKVLKVAWPVPVGPVMSASSL